MEFILVYYAKKVAVLSSVTRLPHCLGYHSQRDSCDINSSPVKVSDKCRMQCRKIAVVLKKIQQVDYMEFIFLLLPLEEQYFLAKKKIDKVKRNR